MTISTNYSIKMMVEDNWGDGGGADHRSVTP